MDPPRRLPLPQTGRESRRTSAAPRPSTVDGVGVPSPEQSNNYSNCNVWTSVAPADLEGASTGVGTETGLRGATSDRSSNPGNLFLNDGNKMKM